MEKYLHRAGNTIAYEQLSGSRAVTVILVHGYGLHRAMWAPQVACLQEHGYPVINMDIRGHGGSRPTRAFSVRLAAEDLQALVDAEKPGQYLLCGLSMGAYVVQEYALFAGGAAGYMLTGTTPLFMAYPKWEKALLASSGAMMRRLYTWQGLKKAMVNGSAQTAPAREKLAQMFEEMNRDEFLVSWQGFSTCLHEEEFVFDAPLLVVAGEQDTRGTIRKHLAAWPRLYPDCWVVTIPHAGHVANLDQPEPFNRLLLSFAGDCLRQVAREG